MRYIYLTLFSCCLFLSSFGQTTNTESFDGTTFVPAGWTNLLTSGSNTWARATTGTYPTCSTHSGAGMAKFNSFSASGGVRSLVTPVYDLSARGSATPTVSFYMYRDNGYNTTADKVDVYMNTAANLTGATLLGTVNRAIGLSPSVGSNGWYLYTYNVPSGFNTMSNYLILKATSAFGDNIFIDDVTWISYAGCSAPAISGTANLCMGQSSTLSDATTGGVWTSSNTSVATIGSSTGVITTTGAGNASILYTVGGCTAALTLTISASPAISATASPSIICPSFTSTLTATATNPGAPAYFVNSIPYSYVTQTSPTAASWSSADDGTTSYTIPFTFTYFGTNYTSVNIGTNGYVQLGGASTGFSVVTFPSTSYPGAIAPFLSDLDILSPGTVTYSTEGTAPNRKFVISYNQAAPCCSFSDSYDGEVILYETSNTIDILVSNAVSGTHTCGIQDPTGSIAVMPPGRNNTTYSVSSSSPEAWRFTIPTALYTWSPSTSLSSTTLATTVAGPLSSTVTYTISSTASNGCSSSYPLTVTVNPSPSAISGSPLLCTGAASTFTDAGSGTWSSSNPAIGSINSSTGVATGIAIGNTTLTYTSSTTGCIISEVVTVNASPDASSFSVPSATTVCSGNPSTITINSGSLSSGTYTVTYGLSGATTSSPLTTSVTMSSGSGSFNTATLTSSGSTTVTILSVTNASGCSASISTGNTATFNVNPIPGAISGTTVVCSGLTTPLTDAGGGNWTSSNPAIATVNFATGTVTGVSGGNSTITYNILGCITTATVTVNADAPITGSSGTCNGTSATVSDASGSGTWSSADPTIASVNPSTGVVTGVSLGLTYITFTLTATGCSVSIPFTITPAPPVYIATGGGAGCAGSSGVHVGLSLSAIGYSYQLYSGTTPIGVSLPGTGWALDFGALTTSGTYTVISNPGTSCATTMYGSATVTVNPLPTAYTVGGGGGYCATGSGVHVSLGGSNIGTGYQLYKNGTTIGSPIPGTGTTIDFGLETAAGTYTVVATTTLTGCTQNMTGNTTVTLNPLPAVFSITGGGGYCPTSTGSVVGISNSTAGISYQLFASGTPVGTPVTGTGSSFSFGPQTSTGTYTIAATNTGTTCTSNMTGSTLVSVNPLPTAFTVTGGGSYCTGTTGLHVGLNSSSIGTSYQLYNGTSAIGTPVAGTSAAIDLGIYTAIGTYTISATTPATTCSNGMTGNAIISTIALPTAYVVSGGGNFCFGGTGVDVALSSSDAGVNYQLYVGSLAVGSATAGSGSGIDFGNQTTPGIYTVKATNITTGCTNTMTSVAVVTVSYPPTAYPVTGGGNYCIGGTGLHVGISNSTSGMSYKLLDDGTAVGGVITGSGGAIDFGLQTTAGSYTVKAASPAGCTSNMTGSAFIVVNPLPAPYTVGGGGGYCAGTSGTHITLSGSDIGTNYTLYKGSSISGTPVPGTGSVLDLGLVSAIGTYTVTANTTTTGCTNGMSGNTVVSINSLPTPYTVTVGGSGAYCAGGTGVPVGVATTTAGISYQLYNNGTATGVALFGSGPAISFGNKTLTGIYSVIATNPATTCNNNMANTITVTTNPLPTAYTVGGGGRFCAGGTGVHVTLSGSASGVNYQLFNSSVGAASVIGSGSAVDFGIFTATGTYTVVALDPVTSCSVNMLSSVLVSTNPLPVAYTVTGGGSYCIHTAGVPVLLSNSDIAVNYQLYNGTTAIGSPVTGTTSVINFGLQTLPGSYSVIATDAVNSCKQTMTLTVAVAVTSTPISYPVSGGGAYCDGGTGIPVGLGGSLGGVNYQLYISGSPSGLPVAGSGSAITFGAQTTAGTYTVIGSDPSSTCSGPMTGSVHVNINPLPVAYTVSGGGSYCAGGTGVHIGLGNSQSGVNYQIYSAGSAVGSMIAGTGAAIDLGIATTAGYYSISALNPTTTCANTMNDSVLVSTIALPHAYPLTGGGNYCPGGTGVSVTLSGSDPAANYQLYNGTAMVGTAVTGTSSSIAFGPYTATGIYNIVATDATTGCSNAMANSDTIGLNSLPTAYPVSGGGNYCAGGAGFHIRLSGSQSGISYQLFNGTTATGTSITGTGAALDLGAQFAAGVYTVVAANATTGCNNTMTGSTSIGINPLPLAFSITGGGPFCTGGTGVHVGLSGSQSGVNYQLYNGTSLAGSSAHGGGSSIDFGLKTAPGSYKVIATNAATGCVNNLPDSTTISIVALPNAYTVTGSSATYCAGGTGIIVYVSNSDVGVSYQLYSGTTPIGTGIPGAGAALNLGSQTIPGTYTVIATTTSGGCSSNMTGSASVSVVPLPNVYPVVGGGNYCSGGSGVHIGVASTQTGVKYQLYAGTTPIGSLIPGTGGGIDLGVQTAAGSYTVTGTNNTTGCVATMSGSATIGIAPLPTVYTTTGGGNYCSGGTGVAVTLSNSVTGNIYQLYYGTTPIGGTVTGTGLALSMGAQTIAGTYTIIAVNPTTGCSNSMAGHATVGINPLPGTYIVTGGGNYCPGGTGADVQLSNSATGITYQLYNGTSAVGSPVAGTGTNVDFGLQTAAGLYKVVATNTITSCVANMIGTAVVGVSELPAVYTVTGGGNYCSGTGGVHIGLSNSAAGITYQLSNSSGWLFATATGSGGAIDFGAITGTGTYTAVAINGTTTCTSNMSSSANVSITTSVLPTISVSTGSGDTVCSGTLTTFTATTTNGGSRPAYQWSVNSVPLTVTGNTYSYIPADGDRVSVLLSSSALCATPATVAANTTMAVLPQLMPSVSIAADPGNVVCNGTAVTFTAIATNGGSAPVYQWKKNGGLESTSTTYTYIPANGDVVYCQMNSNYRCRSVNSVSSPHLSMDVAMPATPTLVVTANPGTHIGTGEQATLTAFVTNGVAPVTYQWYINGGSVLGATTPVYTNSFTNLDTVSCIASTSGACAGITGGAGVRIYVSDVSVKQVAAASSDIQLVPNPNKGFFTLKGTLNNTAEQEVTIEITNMLGQVMYNNKVTVQNGVINEKMQLINVANGMYLLNLHTETGNQVFHMVVEQ